VSVPHADPPATRRSARTPWRLFLRWLAVLCLPAMLASTVSYARALTDTGNTTAVEQSVEWLRGHHFGDTVSWVERTYYSHHQPRKGGTLAGGLPAAVSNGTTPTPAPTANGTAATNDRIQPLASQPLAGEGVWQPYGDAVHGAAAMQVAYLRPDDVHGTVLAAVVRIDQTAASFRLVPGSKVPGHGPWPGGDAVPASDRANLLAAFNSGFRIGDSRGGYMEAGRTAAPLRNGAASMIIDAHGTIDVVSWTNATAASAPVAVRQNLDLIVDGGQLVAGLDDNTGNRWGHTVGNKLFVWRSGIGIDAQGRVLYVASEGLSVRTLAALLQRAGAVRAMELDINHAWVSFNAFHHEASGVLTGSKLLSSMSKPADRYLHPDTRDFVAVISRATSGHT
jgi:hypothetical protein